jgi:hypothetical protein
VQVGDEDTLAAFVDVLAEFVGVLLDRGLGGEFLDSAEALVSVLAVFVPVTEDPDIGTFCSFPTCHDALLEGFAFHKGG